MLQYHFNNYYPLLNIKHLNVLHHIIGVEYVISPINILKNNYPLIFLCLCSILIEVKLWR